MGKLQFLIAVALGIAAAEAVRLLTGKPVSEHVDKATAEVVRRATNFMKQP